MKINFLDLKTQNSEIKREIEASFRRTFSRSDFILGKEEVLFEKEFAQYCGRKFSVGVNSGTDALFLALLSLGIGKNDEVIVPAFTYIATALAVTFTGARPVFVDIEEDTYNIDADRLKKAINKRTKAIIPVHLYGHPADMEPILKTARFNNLKVVEDTAQAHGAEYRMNDGAWRIVGSIGDIGAFSFYPTKNLGACGDGGMIITDKETIYRRLLKLRDYGRKSRYEHVSIGYNSRLDTLQAGILRAKLPHLKDWNEHRRRCALLYTRELGKINEIVTPYEAPYARHVYHIYAIRVRERDRVLRELGKKGVSALIHYPIPLHLQKAYKELGYKKGDFPVAERIAKEIFSLPMHPYLKESEIKYIASVLKEAIS
jgi:dTDP-4-amino-4,6-dideoxygalactose transaminase